LAQACWRIVQSANKIPAKSLGTMLRSLQRPHLLLPCTLLVGAFLVSRELPVLLAFTHLIQAPKQRRLIRHIAEVDTEMQAIDALNVTEASEQSNEPAPLIEAVEPVDDTSQHNVVRDKLKSSIYRLGASLDRGQAYNPTSGDYYAERVEAARNLILELIQHAPPLPTTLADIDGEWELVFSTVKHGIFRSSPFFLAVQEAYGDRETAELFFKLHDLQTHAWGASKVGRVAQHVDSKAGRLYSEFDSSLLSLTAIPVIGFWKLLPTFGGCFATTASVELVGDQLAMEVQYTEMKRVPGLQPASDFVVGPKMPVNEIWQLLPWNNGRRPTCRVTLRYVDEDMRIVSDDFGEYFVYTRPVDPQGVRPR